MAQWLSSELSVSSGVQVHVREENKAQHEQGVVAKKRWTERELRIQIGETKFFVNLLAGGTDMRISPHASLQVPSEETHVYR